tara:strand:- start:203 stop:766 length:564 start_codon:yes stop_codon:yes gene_type:complete
MINIIGGKFKKKKIQVPKEDVRPTSAIKREAIFSILESYAIKNEFDIYKDRCFIDLFSGSGSFGLEAISRGANFVYFYENNNKVIKILLENCNKICKENQYIINHQNSTLIKDYKIDFPLSAIFIDPPYRLNNFDSILQNIIESKILNNRSIIIIETRKDNFIKTPNRIKLFKEKTYGNTKLVFFKN